MNFRHRKTLLQIGDGLEIAGNITLAAAAIFGILSTFIVLNEVANKSKKSSDHARSEGNTTINIISFDPFPSYPSRIDRDRHYDINRFYRDLLVSSAICSIIGTALAISFQVYWVAIAVVSLWTAAAALSYMGRALINYALTLQEPTIEPSAPPFIPEVHQTQTWLVGAYCPLTREDELLEDTLPHATPISEEDARYYKPTVAYYWPGDYTTNAR